MLSHHLLVSAVAVIITAVPLFFVLFIGAAVGVALFHPRPAVRRDALVVLRHLLSALRDVLRQVGRLARW